VLLPQDIENRWHPIWLAIRELLSDQEKENPLVLESLINAEDITRLSPFTCNIQVTDIEPPQPRRPLWDIPQELIHDRETVSASELQDRLACPLKWVLNYQARLRSSPIARLPDDFRLKGTFCHGVFERVFKNGGALPSVENAVAQVSRCFRSASLSRCCTSCPEKRMKTCDCSTSAARGLGRNWCLHIVAANMPCWPFCRLVDTLLNPDLDAGEHKLDGIETILCRSASRRGSG
jgi:hypothetical protein